MGQQLRAILLCAFLLYPLLAFLGYQHSCLVVSGITHFERFACTFWEAFEEVPSFLSIGLCFSATIIAKALRFFSSICFIPVDTFVPVLCLIHIETFTFLKYYAAYVVVAFILF